MEFHDFPTVYGMLKRNGLVEDSPNRFSMFTKANTSG